MVLVKIRGFSKTGIGGKMRFFPWLFFEKDHFCVRSQKVLFLRDQQRYYVLSAR